MKATVANNAKSTKKPGGITGKGFQPGRSGNPSGRPKSDDFAKEVRDFLAERDPKTKGDRTRLLGVLERLEVNDPKILLAYAFGRPADVVQFLAQNEEKPAEFDPSKLTVEELLVLRDLLDKGEGGGQGFEKTANAT